MEQSDDEDYYYYSDEDEYSMGEAEGVVSSLAANGTADDVKMKESKPAESKSSGVGHGQLKAKLTQDLEYSVLTPEVIKAEQEAMIKNICDVLDTSYEISNVLLLHFSWNKEKLLDAYYADPEEACRQSGAIIPSETKMEETNGDADAAGGTKEGDDLFLCNILFIDVPLKNTYAMGCVGEDGLEHRFSIDAWQSYLQSKVDEGKTSIFSRCPARGCKAIVSPSVWAKVLQAPPLMDGDGAITKNKETLKRYQRFLAHSFVDINKNVKWCPGKNCGCAIQASGAVTEVKCTGCNSLFCFKCGLESHAPVSCSALALWMEKCSNESETANWILANTKKCPGCNLRIEKNQGCNHMVCTQCKFDFCWVCSGEWSLHGTNTGGYYNCNVYRSDSSGGDNDKDKAKRELDRYLHYYKRYATHTQSGKFATEQRAKAEKRMVEMQSTSCVGWIDVQFLQQAVEQLIDCRRVLKYTYAFAYYLPNGPKKTLFEYNQAMLEGNTEKLSELSEMDLSTMDRSEVINYTRVTGKFLTSLLEQVESDGLALELNTAPPVSSETEASNASAKRAKTNTRKK
mmetsp:Transcript_19765/g.32478  ORF Transcript_19765/g.32478 Transcript_19765/m.32478 type:complete len:570 (-) Transcript_19765:2669-4378(-)